MPDLEIEYVRPRQTGYQQAAFFEPLDKFGGPARYSFVEGTTKSGKTRGLMDWLHERSYVGDYLNYWWVSPSHGQAAIVYQRFKTALDPRFYRFNDSDKKIRNAMGRWMWFKSGEKPDLLFGEDVGDAVIDEATRMREESFHAVRSTLTHAVGRPPGQLRAIANVKGKKNWFYKLCRRAEQGERGWAHYKITALDAVAAGILPQEEVDDARRLLPEAVFNELYMAVPTDDGSNPFGIKHVAACARLAELSAAPPVAYGQDIARSVDWFVLLGLDAAGAVTRDFERFQKPWEDAYKTVYGVIDRNRAPILADSTGVGDPVVDRLQRDRPRRFHGLKFTPASKQQLMEGLAVAVQRGEVSYTEGVIRQELENFEFVYTRSGVRYLAPEGMHDDCVMALALAVEMKKRVGVLGARRVYPGWS